MNPLKIRNIILSELEESTRKALLEKIINSLESLNQSKYSLGIENLHNLMLNQENENYLENLLPRFIRILIDFLMSNNERIVERVLEIICHFSDMKITTRVLFSKQNNLFSRLLGKDFKRLVILWIKFEDSVWDLGWWFFILFIKIKYKWH